jgi:hypothetical protein
MLLGETEGNQGGGPAAESVRVSSDFTRRTFVEDGIARRNFSSVGISGQSGRVWAVSSLKKCSLPQGCSSESVSVLTFEPGCQVTVIAESAFSKSGLKSIVIPASVIALRKESFLKCNSLESVVFESGAHLERIEKSALSWTLLHSIVIPSSVRVLGKACFIACLHLESVIFESGSQLERIEKYAFNVCMLQSIEIPPHVAFIDGSAFFALPLNLISISPANRNFRISDPYLEDFTGSTIYRYFDPNDSHFCLNVNVRHSLLIRSSVVCLGPQSFSTALAVRGVIFETGSQLERIEYRAFFQSGITSIVIPSSVVVFGKQCFRRCASLESVIFERGSRLERIEESAFSESGLKSIVIPCSVVDLRTASFSYCRSLKSMIFETGSRLRYIQKSAFTGSELKGIAIPRGVLFI